ncbi:unnamed protein product [Rotaria sp. Silwood2]|nr:unnamed protein product [Rotaria sp. Silwood2]CAF4185187.1 unnamed protein product [Rotaria sp. Silwood2]
MNVSLLWSSSINIENSTNTFSSSSRILNVLSTSYTSTSKIIENEFTSSSLSQTSTTSQTVSTIASVNSLVDQMNSYRVIDILARIKHCDSNMKLNDICETYSIDNNTNLLIRQSNIEFHTLQHLSDVLVDRIILQKLNEFCVPIKWCLKNLSESDIYFTYSIIQERGRSFCYLEQCHSRLLVFINTCPILSNTNMSIPTLKLLPMLCTLYNEQERWSSTECIEEIVYLLHMLYGFWPQIEKCYYDISAGFDVCTPECQTFNDILNKSKRRSNPNNRRFDNNYQYTRLNDSPFEFATNTEISNTSSTTNRVMDDESQFDSNDRFRSVEYQRLLHAE